MSETNRTRAVFWGIGLLLLILIYLLVDGWPIDISDKARNVINILCGILIGFLLPLLLWAGKVLWTNTKRFKGLEQGLMALLLIGSTVYLVWDNHLRIVTIRIVGNSYGSLEKELKTFHDEPGRKHIKTELVENWSLYDADQRYSILRNYISGKKRADILELDIIWMEELIKEEALLSLESFYDRDMPNRKYSYKVLREARDDQKTQKRYAVPLYLDVGLVFYRKDLLGTLPEPFVLDPSLLKAIQDILATNKGMEGFVFQSAQYEGLNCLFIELLSSEGVSIVDDKGTVCINSDSVKDVIKLLHDMIYKSGIISPSVLVFKEEESRKLFALGRALVLRNWPYVIQRWEESSKIPKEKIGVTNFEKPVLGGFYLGIMKNSKHPEEAWEIISFLTGRDRLMERERIPADEDTWSSLKNKYEFMPSIKEALNNAEPRPRLRNYSKFSKIISEALFIILGDADGMGKIDDILNEAQKKLEGE